MTTFQDIPREICVMILGNLSRSDLISCLSVCKSWQPIARVLLLKTITLTSLNQILNFIKFKNVNAQPMYMNAVKSMTVLNRVRDRAPFKFTREMIGNVFSRHSQLECVNISGKAGLFDNFDDTVMRTHSRTLSWAQEICC